MTIIGSGYVGLTTGACFAEVGHTVTCVDNDAEKIRTLEDGDIPIYEPGLAEIVQKNVSAGRLKFTTDTKEGVADGEIIFIAVPTPPQADGSVDLRFIEKVAREIAEVISGYKVIVDKSTVPVKTGEKVAETIRRYAPEGVEFDVVSNPEFLREGSAVSDLLNPDRIVIGANSDRALALMQKLYEPFVAPVLVTDINSAEMIKHAANSFLALKISYINAVAAICEKSGADVEKVAEGIGMDQRIGRQFLNAGIGYGGSCFPKDIAAFTAISEQLGIPFDLLKEVQKINAAALSRFIDRIRETLWVLQEKKHRRARDELQTGHRRRALLGRDGPDRDAGRRGRGGDRLRPERCREGKRTSGRQQDQDRRFRAGCVRRRRGARDRHRLARVRSARF